jgi:hypothetical protein
VTLPDVDRGLIQGCATKLFTIEASHRQICYQPGSRGLARLEAGQTVPPFLELCTECAILRWLVEANLEMLQFLLEFGHSDVERPLSDEDVTAVSWIALISECYDQSDHSKAYLDSHFIDTPDDGLQHLGSSSRRLGSVTRKSWHCFVLVITCSFDTCIDACTQLTLCSSSASLSRLALSRTRIQFGVAAGNQMAAILSHFPRRRLILLS